MIYLEALLIALSTYSVIPVPQFEWTDKNMKYAICFFPVVGLVCGLALYLWYRLCAALNISGVMFSAFAVSIPLLISGGIHMDGFMDTVDALSSHRERERKLEILKDPHCGAFAVAYCAIYLLLSFGLFYELYARNCVPEVCTMFVVSRALSALSAVRLPSASKSGMLWAFTNGAEHRAVSISMFMLALLACTVTVLLSPLSGALMLVFALLSLLCCGRLVLRQFGGTTGDTAGFFLQICELDCMLGVWLGAVLS